MNKHNPDTTGECAACSELENVLHLCECDVLYREYWDAIIKTMIEIGMDPPEDTTAFIALGVINRDKVVPNELAGIMFIAWRCLYAEITKVHAEQQRLSVDKAVKRLWAMVHSRCTAYAAKWKRWVDMAHYQRDPRIIPQRYQDKMVLQQDMEGNWVICDAIMQKVREHGATEAS